MLKSIANGRPVSKIRGPLRAAKTSKDMPDSRCVWCAQMGWHLTACPDWKVTASAPVSTLAQRYMDARG